MTKPSTALDGIRILDLTWGPGASVGITMMAEHGADVIKIEPPMATPFRSYHGMRGVGTVSRRSIALDLHTEADARKRCGSCSPRPTCWSRASGRVR